MDLLSSLMDILGVSSAQAATPPPTEAPLPPPNFNIGGGLAGFRQAPQSPVVPPPGVSFGAGPLPVADSIKQLLDQPQAPTQRPPVRQPMAPPMQQPQQAPDNQITGGDVQRFIRSVATGAGRADPRAPGVSAFAQGAMGATQNSYGELERERAIKTKEAEQRRMNDFRAEREARMQQRDLNKDEYFRRREERQANSSALTDRRTQMQIDRIQNPQIDVKDKIALERLIRDKDRDLRREIDNGRLTEKDAKAKLEEYKTQIGEQFKSKRQDQPRIDAPPAGQIIEHQGKRYRFKGGDYNSPDSWEAQ